MVKERHSVAEKRQSVISNKRSSNLIHYYTQGAIHTLTVTVQVRGLATGDGIEEELYVCPPVKLQALVYDILLWRKVSESDARSLCGPPVKLQALVYDILPQCMPSSMSITKGNSSWMLSTNKE